jgi:hypothetical protein
VQVAGLARKGSLRPLLARNLKLQGSQLLLPLGVRLVNFLDAGRTKVLPKSLNWTTVTVSLASGVLEFAAFKLGLLSHAPRPAPVIAELARKLLRFVHLSVSDINQT